MNGLLHILIAGVFMLIGPYAPGDPVRIEVEKQLLRPGESCQVFVYAESVSEGDQLIITGLRTEGVVAFNDTTITVPTGLQNVPFTVNLEVTALEQVVSYGEYAIMVELVKAECEALPSITATGPGKTCDGDVATGQPTSRFDFQWDTEGTFESFQVILYTNRCGKYPSTPTGPSTPTTPTTPTTTPTGPTTGVPTSPTQPTQPTRPTQPTGPGTGQPSAPTSPTDTDTGVPTDTDFPTGDTGLPPLPPGWEWGPTGATWTGEHPPQPPALPPGWEWGPLYPRWVGEGDPPSSEVITASESIAATTADASYTHTFDVGADVQPGEAFVYQIYGVSTNASGQTIGVLSNVMCDRYSPMDDATGETVANNPCPDPEPVCALIPEILAEPAMGGGLQKRFVGKWEINRDDFVPLGAEGRDYDTFKWECQPEEACEETGSKYTLGLSGRVKFTWTIDKGKGEFKQLGCLPENKRADDGDYVIFQPPYVPLPDGDDDYREETTEITLKVIDDNPTQPTDNVIDNKIRIRTRRLAKDPDIYEVYVEAPEYKLPSAPKENKTTGDCQAKKDWKLNTDLVKPKHQLPPVEDKDKMVVGQLLQLRAVEMRDKDKLIYKCISGNCESTVKDKDFEDNVEWKWFIKSFGAGKFVTGKTHRSSWAIGKTVVYEAPASLKKPYIDVKMELEVTDNLANTATIQLKDKVPKRHKFTIRVYRAGVEMERTPTDWLPEKDNNLEIISKLKYESAKNKWSDALAHMCRIHFVELNDVTHYLGHSTNSPAFKEANVCRDLRLTDGDHQEAYQREKMPTHPSFQKATEKCDDHKEYLLNARSNEPEKEFTVVVDSEDYASFGTLASWAARDKGKHRKSPKYVSIPLRLKSSDHPDGRKKKVDYRDNRITIPRDIDENHVADHGWITKRGRQNFKNKDPKDRKADRDFTAKGDSYGGDGLSEFEEYRGFEVVKPHGPHVRTSWAHKDLFVWNEVGVSLKTFRKAFSILAYEVKKEHIWLNEKDAIYYINFNKTDWRILEQAGLRMYDGRGATLDGEGLLGYCDSKRTGGRLGPPNIVRGVLVNVEKVKEQATNKGLPVQEKMRQVVAHELGHAINTYHHGEKSGDSWDGVNGPRSGNVICVMRYDNFKDAKETIGSSTCDVKNKDLNFLRPFGPPARNRGACSTHWRINGSDKAPKAKKR